MSDVIKQHHAKGTLPYVAEKVAEAVKAYQDTTAQKHECVGFDCSRCAFNGDRFAELAGEIEQALNAEIEQDKGAQKSGGI